MGSSDERMTVTFTNQSGSGKDIAASFLADVMQRRTTDEQKRERIMKNTFGSNQPIKAVSITGKGRDLRDLGLDLFPEIEKIGVSLTMGHYLPFTLDGFPQSSSEKLNEIHIRGLVTSLNGLPTSMPKLEKLYIDGNNRYARSKPSVTTHAISMPSIKSITMQDIRLTRFPLDDTALPQLNIFLCKACDLAEFMPRRDQLPTIRLLDLEENHLETFDSFPFMSNLEFLTLDNNSFTDLEGIERFPNTKKIKMRKNFLVDILALNNRDQPYEEIDLHDNKITSIDSLKITPKGLKFDLSENQISTISNAHINSEEILIKSNKLESVRGLSAPNTEILSLSQNNLKKIDLPIETMQSLETLKMHFNALTSLEGLNAPQLKRLEVSKNKLTSLRSDAAMPNLTNLDASENELVSTETLLQIHPRAAIDLTHNPLRNLRGLNEQQFLRATYHINSLSPMAREMSRKCGQFSGYNRPDANVDASTSVDCRTAYKYLSKSFQSEFAKFNSTTTSMQDRHAIFTYLMHEAHPLYYEIVASTKAPTFPTPNEQIQYEGMMHALKTRFDDLPLVYGSEIED